MTLYNFFLAHKRIRICVLRAAKKLNIFWTLYDATTLISHSVCMRDKISHLIKNTVNCQDTRKTQNNIIIKLIDTDIQIVTKSLKNCESGETNLVLKFKY